MKIDFKKFRCLPGYPGRQLILTLVIILMLLLPFSMAEAEENTAAQRGKEALTATELKEIKKQRR